MPSYQFRLANCARLFAQKCQQKQDDHCCNEPSEGIGVRPSVFVSPQGLQSVFLIVPKIRPVAVIPAEVVRYSWQWKSQYQLSYKSFCAGQLKHHCFHTPNSFYGHAEPCSCLYSHTYLSQNYTYSTITYSNPQTTLCYSASTSPDPPLPCCFFTSCVFSGRWEVWVREYCGTCLPNFLWYYKPAASRNRNQLNLAPNPPYHYSGCYSMYES